MSKSVKLLHCVQLLCYVLIRCALQDDVELKKKLREEQKLLSEAKIKASGKGPIGTAGHAIYILLYKELRFIDRIRKIAYPA